MLTSPRVPALGMMLLVAAACGADDAEQVGDTTGDVEAQQPADEDRGVDEAGGADAGAGTTGVDGHVTVSSSELGDMLVDDQGMTLYLFTEDVDGQSVCEDDCAAAWPPLIADEPPVAGAGVDGALLDTLERSDGSTQVSYAGWPLYTWAQDQQPGDVTGQGVQDVWFVVSPEGEPIRDGDDPEPAGDGY
jgi:predicted lipoprotein with Yx(FWY)xxD motif